jgi:2-octaprenyl-6-methoxyphenol hydroxylase
MLARDAPDPTQIVLIQKSAPLTDEATSPTRERTPQASTHTSRTREDITPESAPHDAAGQPLRLPKSAILPGASSAIVAATSPLDPHVLALNHGSLTLLEGLDVHLPHTAAIHHIHVSQRGRFGRTLIHNTDFGVPQLGSVASYSSIQKTLKDRLATCGITVINSHGATLVDQDAHGVWVRIDDNQELRAAIAVISDGLCPAHQRRQYQQHAVVTTVRSTHPQDRWAFERFTRTGPLALLPHPHAADCYALVWCCPLEQATELAALNDAAFSLALSHAFGERLGTLSPEAPRHVAPLFMGLRRPPVEKRAVAIGNAAQTLHPVAGQGLNLALRDAARLAQVLTPWLHHPHWDPTQALQDYTRARRADRWLTVTLTDLLSRIFTSNFAPVEHTCGLALLSLDLCSPLRTTLVKHLLQGWRT